MRNLKRVLSLALASIMLLGMMVIGASAADKTAADLTDIDKVTNTEAVALMVDLGIIEGKPDGSFAPTETVDRATMAKLITLILMGDVDGDTFAGTNTNLKDVPDNNWAKGFINYCYSNNIIAGDGKGNFFPSTKVKVVEAAKMLLVALGYDAADRGYVGDNWSVNIMKDAKTKGLLDGFDANKAQNELTRDNAAQMIFNALMATTVTPNYDRDMGEKYVSGYTEGNTLGYETYSMVKITAKVGSITDGKADITDLIDAPKGINVANVTGKIAASANTIGQNVSIYVKANLTFDKNGDVTGATFKEIYTSSIQNSTSTLLATSTKGLTIAKLTEKKNSDGKTNRDYLVSLAPDTKDSENNTVINVSYFLNGKESTKEEVDKIAAKGVVIEFYDVDGDGLADVVKVIQKKVTTLTADPKERTNSDGELEVLIKGAGLSSRYVAAVGYEDLAEDDVVLYYQDSADVYHFELADSFTGKVTNTNSSNQVRVNGTYYSASGMATGLLVDWNDFDNEYTFYTDNGGYIVKAETVGEKTSDKYAIVLESAWVSGGGVGASKYMEAKLLLSDGTIEIVKVSKIDGKTVVAAKTSDGKDNVAGEDEVLYKDLTSADGFFSYIVKSDKYQLTPTNDGTIAKNAAINPTAKFDGTNVSNAKTVFVVEKGKGDDVTYTAYTGFNNLPKMTATTGAFVKDGSIATYVFLSTVAFSDDAPEGYVYIKDTSKFSRDSKGNYGYDIVNAEGETKDQVLWVDDKLAEKQTGIFTVGILTDGIASKNNVKPVTTKTGTMTAIGNDIVQVDSNVYTYDADTIFVTITLNQAGKFVEAGTADPSNYTLDDSKYDDDTAVYTYTGYVIANSDGLASYIYLVIGENEAPST